MQASQSSIFWRDDTLLGVCEALGEDFRFNPLFLRAALAVGLLWNPFAMIGAYLGLAVIVLISRLLSPNPRMAARSETAAAHEPRVGEEVDQYLLPIAA